VQAHRLIVLLVAIVSSVSCATVTFYTPTDANLVFSSASCGTPNIAARVLFSNPDAVGHLRLFPSKSAIGVNLQVVFPKTEPAAAMIEVLINSRVLNLKQAGLSVSASGNIAVMYQGELSIPPPGKVSVLIPPLRGSDVNNGRSIEFELRSEVHGYSCLQ